MDANDYPNARAAINESRGEQSRATWMYASIHPSFIFVCVFVADRPFCADLHPSRR